MIRIALLTLMHDRGKLAAAVAGVAFASMLVLTQIGMYYGFVRSASAVVTHIGGDVWVMARGTQVADNNEPISAGSRVLLAAHPCVRNVRAVVLAFAAVRKASFTRDTVTIVGFEPGVGADLVPWNLTKGVPQDLHGPWRVAIDDSDLGKLQMPANPIGSTLEVNGHTVYVAALSHGVRSFTLTPYLFTEVTTARRLANLAEDQASYWVLRLRDTQCRDDVVHWVDGFQDLDAWPTATFARMTEDYWVGGSGAGTALAFSAILGLVVGAVIVGQTLFSITKEHMRELATLKAIGATNSEIVRFVAWQAGFLAVVGGGLGLALSVALQHGVERAGLVVVLSPKVLAIGIGAVVFMCTLASAGSARAVIRLEAAEVFR